MRLSEKFFCKFCFCRCIIDTQLTKYIKAAKKQKGVSDKESHDRNHSGNN